MDKIIQKIPKGLQDYKDLREFQILWVKTPEDQVAWEELWKEFLRSDKGPITMQYVLNHRID